MEGLKIVTIGGGSSYTPEFVEGLIKRYHNLPVKSLWFVDVEEGLEKMTIVGNLAKRMIAEAKLDIEVHLTLDRETALKDADFVTTQLRVGQLRAREKDERIPLSHGFLGQETNGAGGLFKALRTVPVILKIADDMTRLCPNAWLINFTNPAGVVTEALLKYSKHKKVIGVCNVPIGMEMDLAKQLKLDREALQFRFIGLNHMIFMTEVKQAGVDLMPKAIDLFTQPKEATVANIKEIPWERTFIESLNAILCPYHRYYFKYADMLAIALEEFKTNTTRAEKVMKVEAELFELYKNPELRHKPEQLALRGGAHYSDAACNLIYSIYNDVGDIQTVNTMNKGTLPYFDDDSAIECSCVIDKDGPKPVKGLSVPISCKGLVQEIKNFEQLAAKAAVTGDYNTGLQAIVTNRLVSNDVLGKVMYDELLEAHKAYLPQFNIK